MQDAVLAQPVRLGVHQAQVMHGKENAPVHRLQAISHIRERPPDDNRHGILHRPACVTTASVWEVLLYCRMAHLWSYLVRSICYIG